MCIVIDIKGLVNYSVCANTENFDELKVPVEIVTNSAFGSNRDCCRRDLWRRQGDEVAREAVRTKEEEKLFFVAVCSKIVDLRSAYEIAPEEIISWTVLFVEADLNPFSWWLFANYWANFGIADTNWPPWRSGKNIQNVGLDGRTFLLGNWLLLPVWRIFHFPGLGPMSWQQLVWETELGSGHRPDWHLYVADWLCGRLPIWITTLFPWWYRPNSGEAINLMVGIVFDPENSWSCLVSNAYRIASEGFYTFAAHHSAPDKVLRMSTPRLGRSCKNPGSRHTIIFLFRPKWKSSWGKRDLRSVSKFTNEPRNCLHGSLLPHTPDPW